MESFSKLKQRGANLFGSIPQHMPSMPQMHMPSMPSMPRMGGGPGMKGTWQHISLPSLPRSSHSLDIIAGNAYIFGGEIGGDGRKPIDNDMHIVVLPWSGAPADYYAVKAKASPKSSSTEEGGNAAAIPTIITEEDETESQLKDPLTEVPLSSSPPASTVTPSADSESESESEPSTPSNNNNNNNNNKGKALETADVPPPRIGHATAVIGTRIFMFGGRSGDSSSATTILNENGRVWVFETQTHSWTYLDPHRSSPVPPPRSDHSAAATDKPRDFAATGPRRLRRAPTWKEWAEGDSGDVGIPQRPITGSIAARAGDDEGAGFGTFIIHAGRIADGLVNDVWAFDVHARTWKQLPDAPGPARSGAALALAKGRLYRFGGSDEQNKGIGGRLDVLQLGLDEFDDRNSKGEIGVSARGGWESIIAPTHLPPAIIPAGVVADPDAPAAETAGLTTPSPSSSSATTQPSLEPWPPARTAANLSLVQAGGGREYLLLSHGEASSSTSSDGPSSSPSPSPSFHSDIWAFQVPPLGGTAASVADAFLQTVGRKTSSEGRWYPVTPSPYDYNDDDETERYRAGPAPRGWAGAAPLGDLEENAIFVAGGVGEEGGETTRRRRPLGDGWIFRLE